MKKKIFISLIAVVVVAAIVGSAFAAFVKEDSKTIELSTGEAMFLSIGGTGISGTSLQVGSDLFDPDHPVALPLTLSVQNKDKGDSNLEGRFKVIVEAASEAEADIALASAINVSASGTKETSGAFTANKAALTDTDGIAIDLEDIPTSLVLTFSIANDDFTLACANGEVNITIKWYIKDNWTPDADTYYIVGTMTGWQISRDNIVLSTDPSEIGSNTAVLKNISFTSGDEFKIVKGTTDVAEHWYSCNGESASVTAGTVEVGTGDSDGNCVVKTTGAYCIYQNGSSFYVGPYPENP